MVNHSSTKTKGTTKSNGRKHKLDKFYTKPEIASFCIQQVSLKEYNTIIEPSAGNGSFSNQIENITAFDLQPEHSSIKQQNWFEYKQERNKENKTLVIGNPPFGEQNSLAISFINHAATFADTIAFILPLSFLKGSIQDKIDPYLHLSQSTVLPNNAFTLEGKDVNVPAVFQIWNFDENKIRQNTQTPNLLGFRFVKKGENPDLYIQRVGGRAGSYGTDWENRSEQSNYFIKINKGYTVSQVLQELSLLKHPTAGFSTGPKSLSKKELLLELKANKSKLVD